MIKIPTLFKRDMKTHLVYNELVEGTEWVAEGRGYATQKHDGTSCMVESSFFYKRLTVKKGCEIPVGARPCQSEPDACTGKLPCWVRVNDSQEDRWHMEARNKLGYIEYAGACTVTFELVGPKINGNKEKLDSHILVRHGSKIYEDVPRDFEGLKEWLSNNMIEGIVFYQGLPTYTLPLDPLTPMVKIKRRDFGLKW